jgi:cytidine deaminase
VWKAVSTGEHDFAAIAVTAKAGEGAPPCGSCRQVLHEFSPRVMVYWKDGNGRVVKRRLDALLPLAFDLASRRKKSRMPKRRRK